MKTNIRFCVCVSLSHVSTVLSVLHERSGEVAAAEWSDCGQSKQNSFFAKCSFPRRFAHLCAFRSLSKSLQAMCYEINSRRAWFISFYFLKFWLLVSMETPLVSTKWNFHTHAQKLFYVCVCILYILLYSMQFRFGHRGHCGLHGNGGNQKTQRTSRLPRFVVGKNTNYSHCRPSSVEIFG